MAVPSRSDALAGNRSAANALLFARVIALLAITVGGVVLGGWFLDMPVLRHGPFTSVAMKPNAAVGLIVAGVGLLTFSSNSLRALSRLLGLALIVGGGATLGQDVFGWDLRIDQLVFPEPAYPAYTSSPGRMSPVSAVSFILIGIAFNFARRGRFLSAFADLLLAAVIIQNLLVLIGYLYGVPKLYYPFPMTAIPVQAAAMLLLLGVATFAATPERGIAAAVLDRSVGGQMIRNLLPWIVVMPVTLGWLERRGFLAGYYDQAVSTVLLAVSSIILLVAIVWVTGNALARSDFDRQTALTQLHDEREWLRTTLASIADGVIVTDANGTVLLMNGVAEELTGWRSEDAATRPIWEVFGTVDEASRNPVDSAGLVALRERSTVKNTVHLLPRPDGTEVPVEHSGAPILGPGKLVVGAVLIFRDITERRKTEERQNLLVRELNHRVRNVLMIVHSLVQASARHASSEEAAGMARVLGERLRALNRAHELLLDTQWTGASLDAMARRELEPFQGEETDRVTIKGPDVLLPPQSTSMLAMALHELTTNAAKYGALSQPDGRLSLTWRVKGGKLELKWIESGVKIPVQERKKVGFGTELIEHGIGRNLGGKSHVEIKDDGLNVSIEIALDGQPAEEHPLSRPDLVAG